jgi:hypothetical protein
MALGNGDKYDIPWLRKIALLASIRRDIATLAAGKASPLVEQGSRWTAEQPSEPKWGYREVT